MSWSKSYATVADFENGVESYPNNPPLGERQARQLTIARTAAEVMIKDLREETPDAEFNVQLYGHANDAGPGPGDNQGARVERVARKVVETLAPAEPAVEQPAAEV